MRSLFNYKTLASVCAVMLFSACSESKTDNTAAASKPATATEEKVVNLYSARHYDVDDKLYAEFTKQTGIKVNVVKGKAPELIEKLKMEGDASSADIFMTVDGGILNSAKEAGLLQPIDSAKINEAVPAHLRDADNQWVALSSRARIIAYVKGKTDPSTLSTYEDLANEKWKGKVLVVSVINPGFVATPLTAGNDFTMPALISPEAAADAILQGWARGQFDIHFPKRFTRVMKLLRLLPYRWYFPAVRRFTGL